MSMIGKTLAHYEITSQLGKGGMGEVYQAKDRKLRRKEAASTASAGEGSRPKINIVVNWLEELKQRVPVK
jgi:serine/threonine protein kinase